jgi:beta-glucanase (GH16 family)
MLTWQDTFSDPAGSPPDPRWWTAYTNGAGNGNGEAEYYLPSEAAQNGAGLALTAHRSSVYQAQYAASQFTSGKVSTKGKVEWRYGHLVAEATLPCGGQPGAWPAIWMLGAADSFVTWPACGEIDVMESFGTQPSVTEVTGALHTGQNWAQAVTLASPVTEKHSYELIWRPDCLQWAADGTVYQTVERSQVANWVFDQPCYLILNLAIGGTMGGAVPPSAVMPYEMIVNSVSLYDAELTTAVPVSCG